MVINRFGRLAVVTTPSARHCPARPAEAACLPASAGPCLVRLADCVPLLLRWLHRGLVCSCCWLAPWLPAVRLAKPATATALPRHGLAYRCRV
jgi:hypothetical protein